MKACYALVKASFISLFLAVAGIASPAASAASADGAARISSHGLPRVGGDRSQPQIASNRFESYSPLAHGVGAHRVQIIPKGADWTHPLRRKSGTELYVTIVLTASLNTRFDIGPWGFRLAESGNSFEVALQYLPAGESVWKDTGIVSALDDFAGSRLAALPVLTLRFAEDVKGVELFANMTPLSTLDPGTSTEGKAVSSKSIRISGGAHGAWLSSIVQADTNPLYVDDNANGIDDDFEAAYSRSANKTSSSRDSVRSAWKGYQFSVGSQSLIVDRPTPASVNEEAHP